jgi:hypothetical protein
VSGADGGTKIYRTGDAAAGDVLEAEWRGDGPAVQQNGPFSQDGRLLAQALVDRSLAVRDAASGNTILRVPAEVAARASQFWDFTPDAAEFWVLQPRGIRVYSLRGGPEAEIAVPEAIDTGGTHTVEGVYAFSARERNHVVLVDIPHRRVAGVHDMGGQAFCCAISPGGEWLFAGSGNGTIRRLSLVEPDRPADTLAIHNGAVTGMAFHPDGDWLITFSWDGTMAQVDAGSGARLGNGAMSGSFLAWSADGGRMAWREGMSGDVVLCEAAGRDVCRVITLPPSARPERFDQFAPLFTADGQYLLVTGKDGIRAFETVRGRWRSFSGIGEVTHFERAGTDRFIALTPGGMEEILSGTSAGGVLQLSKGKVLKALHRPNGLGVSRDGATVAALLDQEAWIFRGSGNAVRVDASPAYRNINISPDGARLVLRGTGAEVRDPSSKEPGLMLPLGGTPAFFGQPLRIIGPHLNEPAMECYDVASGSRLWRTPLDRALGLTTVISGDETMAAVKVGDRMVLVECATGRMLVTLQHPAPQPVSTAAFSPDGTKLAVSTCEGTVQLWDLRLLKQELTALGLRW